LLLIEVKDYLIQNKQFIGITPPLLTTLF